MVNLPELKEALAMDLIQYELIPPQLNYHSPARKITTLFNKNVRLAVAKSAAESLDQLKDLLDSQIAELSLLPPAIYFKELETELQSAVTFP